MSELLVFYGFALFIVACFVNIYIISEVGDGGSVTTCIYDYFMFTDKLNKFGRSMYVPIVIVFVIPSLLLGSPFLLLQYIWRLGFK